jgi:hypothetical protein
MCTFAIICLVCGPIIPVGILSFVDATLNAFKLKKDLDDDDLLWIGLWSLLWPIGLTYRLSSIIGISIANRIHRKQEQQRQIEAITKDVLSYKL